MNVVLHRISARAQRLAIEARRKTGANLQKPICVFDLCERLGLGVRFVDFSMEGLLIAGTKPTILLSSLRPRVRRVYTCAHELGHMFAGHGHNWEELLDGSLQPRNNNERLADYFAGHL